MLVQRHALMNFRAGALKIRWDVVVPFVLAAVAIVSLARFARPTAAVPVPADASPRVVRPVALPPGGTEIRTGHYRIYSSADAATTREVGAAVEALHAAYRATFPTRPHAALQLVLYRDRAQFKQYNRSASWAEAYYRAPRCHAYAGPAPNRHHWMLHEATHQLLREVSGYRPARWANEGIASYFGASRVVRGRLRPGLASGDAYPVWWLPRTALTGDLRRDVEGGAIVGLDGLLDSDGVDIGPHLNAYYVGWWSLAHFLLHGQGGRHADGFRQVVAEGATRESFERHIGPVGVVERQWYAYLRAAVEQSRSAGFVGDTAAFDRPARQAATTTPSAAPADTPRRGSRR